MAKTIYNLTDSILVQKWKDGDKQAFKILFDRHFSKLLQYTTSRISDTELAEELVMDVMTRLWQHHKILLIQNSLSPWLFRSVKNAIIDYKRKKALKIICLDETDFEHPMAISPEEQYHASELQQLMAELPA